MRAAGFTLSSLALLQLPRLTGYAAAPPPASLLRRSDVVRSEADWGVLLARARGRLAKAYRLLSEGVEDEACEEAWRAAIDAVNAAAAATWGVEARSHRALRLLVGMLRERGLDLLTEFGVAESLHAYYYNPGGYDKEAVRAMLGHVERLIEKVEEWVREATRPQRHIAIGIDVSTLTLLLLTRTMPRLAGPRFRRTGQS